MKGLLGLLMLTFTLYGCSYQQDMHDIYTENIQEAEEIINIHSDRIDLVDEYK